MVGYLGQKTHCKRLVPFPTKKCGVAKRVAEITEISFEGGTGSGSCSVADFYISCLERSSSVVALVIFEKKINYLFGLHECELRISRGAPCCW